MQTITVLDPHGQPSGIFGRRLNPTSKPSDILDPVHQPSTHDPKPLTMAPRLDTVAHKVLYLVDTGFGGSFELLTEMQDWFAKNMPSVKTVVKRKRGTMFTDDPELWAEVQQNANAAVLGVGG